MQTCAVACGGEEHSTRQNLHGVSSRRAQRGEIPVAEALLNVGDPSRAFGMTQRGVLSCTIQTFSKRIASHLEP